MSQVSLSMQRKEVLKVYHAFFHSFLNYGNLLWANQNLNQLLFKKTFRRQKRAIRILKFGKAIKKQSCRGIFKEFGILTLVSIFILQAAVYAFKHLKMKTNDSVHSYNTRNKGKIHMLHHEGKSIIYFASLIYNKIPVSIKSEDNQKSFKVKLKKWLIEREFYSFDEFNTDWEEFLLHNMGAY